MQLLLHADLGGSMVWTLQPLDSVSSKRAKLTVPAVRPGGALRMDPGAAVVTPPPTAPEALPSAQSVASRLLPPAPHLPAPAGADDVEGATSRAVNPVLDPGIPGIGVSPLPTPPGGSLSPGLIASLAGFRELPAQGGSAHPGPGAKLLKRPHAQGSDASLAALRKPNAPGGRSHFGSGAKPPEQPHAQVATAGAAAAAAAAATALETAAAAVLRAQCGAAGQSLAGPGHAGYPLAAWPIAARAAACARRGRSQGGCAALSGAAERGALGLRAASAGRSGGRAPGKPAPAPVSAACVASHDFSA